MYSFHFKLINRQTEQQEQSPSSKETNETDSVAGSPCSSDSSTNDISKTQSSLRWFKCIDCGKAFSSQAKLSAHMRTHAGNRSFKCSIEVIPIVTLYVCTCSYTSTLVYIRYTHNYIIHPHINIFILSTYYANWL